MDKDSSYCKIKQNAGYGLHHIWHKLHMVINFGKYPVYSRTIFRIELLFHFLKIQQCKYELIFVFSFESLEFMRLF